MPPKKKEQREMKHKVRIIPKEEILNNRCSKYKFLNFDNMYLDKHFCDFEQSVSLRDLGFKEECICGYNRNLQLVGKIIHSTNGSYLQWDEHDIHLPAPLKSQALNFFREKYKYWCYVFPNIHDKDWVYHIQFYNGECWGETFIKNGFATYESAEKELINKMIEMCKTDGKE